MEKAAAVRRAALEAVEDVEPETLRENIERHLAEGSIAPGVLTLLSAEASDDRTDDVVSAPLAERGAGVQLIYDGLRLTRALSHDIPWVSGERESADIDILVADILVARGFHLLARTEAADAAVSTVRSFGRDQTVRREADDPSLDDNLESDVFELAVVAGTTALGRRPGTKVREYADELARNGNLGVGDGPIPESVRERLSTLLSSASGDGVTQPPTENRNA